MIKSYACSECSEARGFIGQAVGLSDVDEADAKYKLSSGQAVVLADVDSNPSHPFVGGNGRFKFMAVNVVEDERWYVVVDEHSGMAPIKQGPYSEADAICYGTELMKSRKVPVYVTKAAHRLVPRIDVKVETLI